MQTSQKNVPLGISLNNPANIRSGSSRWFGLNVAFPSYKGFCRFLNIEYGVRALICLLRTYYKKYHLQSVFEIVSRYAPSSENDTSAYIKNVCYFMQINDSHAFISLNFSKKNRPIPIYDETFLLCSAICRQETGYILSYEMFKTSLNLL